MKMASYPATYTAQNRNNLSTGKQTNKKTNDTPQA